MNANIGDILIKLRKESQLTMDMLVEDINYKYGVQVNKSMISRWERNENDPSLEMAIILAKYYNVSLDYLIGLTDVKTPARLLASANKKKSEEPVLNLNHPRASLTTRPILGSRPGIVPESVPRRPSPSKQSKDDDDFEFEFLNMDDDKKGRK